jgi:hypothetical protein
VATLDQRMQSLDRNARGDADENTRCGLQYHRYQAGTFSAPYHGICKTGIQHWEPGKFAEGDEVALRPRMAKKLNL